MFDGFVTTINDDAVLTRLDLVTEYLGVDVEDFDAGLNGILTTFAHGGGVVWVRGNI